MNDIVYTCITSLGMRAQACCGGSLDGFAVPWGKKSSVGNDGSLEILIAKIWSTVFHSGNCCSVLGSNRGTCCWSGETRSTIIGNKVRLYVSWA